MNKYKTVSAATSLLMSMMFFAAITSPAGAAEDTAMIKSGDGHDHAAAHGDDHAEEDAHGDDHAGEDAHGDDHAEEDAHGDDHAGEDAHGDDHAGEDAQGDVVRMASEVAQAAGIVLEQAESGVLGESLSLPAEIRFDANRVANVSPRVTGVVDKLFAGEGDKVAVGDVLALITSRELAELKAQWLLAETRKSLASQALERAERLWSQKITSEAIVQEARAEHETAKTESIAAETALHAVGVDHADLDDIAVAADGSHAKAYLISPVSGTVIRREISLGETVTAGDASTKVLFTIADDSVLWVDVAVYEQDISRVRAKAPVALKKDDGEVIAQSKVEFVLPFVDDQTRTATARVIVNNTDKVLFPGQFVIADVSVGGAAEVLRVPQSAVQLVEGRPSVFVPVDGGFEPRAVLAGKTAGGNVEIKAGLEEGELFVSDGAFTLKAQLEKDAFGDGHGH